MPMREECKHFQSRTYASGEVARYCQLDLAPEAPWRCPTQCPKYERRLADAAWVHGSLVPPKIEDEPDGDSNDIAELLRDAEDVVEEALPSALHETEETKKSSSFFRRRKK